MIWMTEDEKIPGDQYKDDRQPGEQPDAHSTEKQSTGVSLPAGQPGQQPTGENSQSLTDPPDMSNKKSEIPESEIKKMEVHHPHHVTHKKKWPEYLLEFFMLFLAVFLGFVAENVRENYVERHREKEYIQSEINDLRSDTAEFGRIISRYQLKVLQMDTLITLLHSPDKRQHLNEIYFLGRVSSFTPRFTYNDGTIQQLKNAGGLRLIKNKGVADSIMIYDTRINEIKSQGEVLAGAARDYRSQANKIFDPFIFYQILKGTLVSAERPLNSPSLLSYDAQKINDVISQVMYLRSIFLVTMEMCKSTKALAASLIALLQKEYHLD